MNYSIDDAGWGCPLQGCIIVLTCDDMDRLTPFIGEIEVAYFQNPLFQTKKYLERAYELVKEGIGCFGIGKGDFIYCCSGYILSLAVDHLRKDGYQVHVESHTERKAHTLAEKAFIEKLKEIGAPVDRLLPDESKKSRAKNFYILLNWAREDPERKRFLKNGWRFFQGG